MPYARGEVVDVLWPHSDLTGVTPHPALVIQCERVFHPIDQYVCALITSRNTHVGAPSVHVAMNAPEAAPAGLTKDCFIILDTLATIKASAIQRRRGQFGRMDLVDHQLRLALRLPSTTAPATPSATR
jgi:mRNA-degrading endonuclease toxin of MazEF toxin-antitoxin module